MELDLLVMVQMEQSIHLMVVLLLIILELVVAVVQRHLIGLMLPDLVFGCLRQAIPERVPAGDPPDRLRFSAWPPTLLMRLKRYVRYHYPGWFPGTPKMQMYALGRDEVLRALSEAGAEVLSVDQSEHGSVDNLVYIARRIGAR